MEQQGIRTGANELFKVSLDVFDKV